MIQVGDKITLEKPMGVLSQVGKQYTVSKIDGEILYFTSERGYVGMTFNELDTFFTYDKKEETSMDATKNQENPIFHEGDRIVMISDAPMLYPMEQGDCFIIDKLQYGVAILTYDGEDEVEGVFNISENLLINNFKLVDNCDDECEENCPMIFSPITDEEINEILEASEIKVVVTFDLCATATCKLPCGFAIAASITCMDQTEFDEKTATSLCLPQLKDTIRKFENYRRMANAHHYAERCCGECEDCE